MTGELVTATDDLVVVTHKPDDEYAQYAGTDLTDGGERWNGGSTLETALPAVEALENDAGIVLSWKPYQGGEPPDRTPSTWGGLPLCWTVRAR